MSELSPIRAALRKTRAEIDALARKYGREPGTIALLAVSKTKPVEMVEEALSAGQKWFGENQLQDALTKIRALPDTDAVWHFIGPVQSNKTRSVAEHFQWCHSIERLKIATRLNDQRPQDLPPMDVCLQVNIDGEASKAGVTPAEVFEMADGISRLPRLRLRGLMGIPKPRIGLEAQREPHRRLRELLESLQQAGHTLDTLSIGMSDDMEAAIAEGSTLVRIGTAIFGARAAKSAAD